MASLAAQAKPRPGPKPADRRGQQAGFRGCCRMARPRHRQSVFGCRHRADPRRASRRARWGRTMTPLDEALAYASAVPVFPCIEDGPTRKRPRTSRGFHNATRDPATIERWWRTGPWALVGMPTGRAWGRWVLDIDVKRPEENGFDTLEDLGHAFLPDTPMAHTA